MAGRKKKSPSEAQNDQEITILFSQQFKKACQKKFSLTENDEITYKELFRLYEYLDPENASLCLNNYDKNNAVRGMRDWLNGESIPDHYTLKKICDKECLNCSLDFLFGRIECTKYDIQFIHDETGLSEEAIKQLSFLYHSKPDEFRNNIASLSYLLEYIPFSETLLQWTTTFLLKYWDCEKGKELYEDEKKRRSKKSDIEQLRLEMSGYKPLMTVPELGKLKERKDVALFHATTIFSSVLTKIAEILYKDFQKGEKTTLVNQLQGGCLYFNLPRSKDNESKR